ncbi:BrnT family toxin [Geminocystis herdmanii]|uniref:BrnT family toxin n=1 Tax=Geminocystis herdmanii TaxID=669359 RepID=UPI0003685CB1|nr:BrnT family toxin [Geminocystis herdmanii]
MGGYEWDENKNKKNLEKHKISFEVAIDIFKNPVLTKLDTRDYKGEIRFLSIGKIDDNVYLFIVWTQRNINKRIISVRSASNKERKIYYEYIERRTT